MMTRHDYEHDFATREVIGERHIPAIEAVLDQSLADLDQARNQGPASAVFVAEREVLRSAANFAEIHRIHHHAPGQDARDQQYWDDLEAFNRCEHRADQAAGRLARLDQRIAAGSGPVEREDYLAAADACFLAQNDLHRAGMSLRQTTTPVIEAMPDYDFAALAPSDPDPDSADQAVLEVTGAGVETLDQARELMIRVCRFDAGDPRTVDLLTAEQQSRHVAAVITAIETFRSMLPNQHHSTLNRVHAAGSLHVT
ncbi:hypothetical protein AB0X98_07820 [Rothia koreensis]|uniref:hypothetical protein n=1 Tax=Rothia koreensis TaxID=592378 RepID=UPI003F20A5EB